MGKSPGKWIKTLLFGKKATRSQGSKGRSASKAGTDKGYSVTKGPPASTENSPVISEPVLVSTCSNGINSELESGKPSSLRNDAPTTQVAEKQGMSGSSAETDPEKVREEQAAIKAQAAFRGFLARRAFHALRGIIRLQALVRGHLVRRQAVVTLHSILGIIKLQALARGQKVAKGVDSRKGKLYRNTFVCKLLSSSLVVMPLQIQYDQGEPNSVFSWMDRWTLSHFWNPPTLPKKTTDSKSQTRRGTYAMETESCRTKRLFKRNSSANVDSISNTNSELEKTKRNMRKLSTSCDTAPEHPQSELEKVKRNLRKITSSMVETSDRSEMESEKQSRSMKNIADSLSDAPHQSIDDSAENTRKDVAPTPETKPNVEIASETIPAERPVDVLEDNHSAHESHPLQSINKDENISVMNGELSLKEEHAFNENQKTNKRRASFSAKPEYTEDGVQNSPKLPSYMQATESAKAKLRAQNSPSFGTDSAEKSGITRRHSLPSGKATSHSPRTQRIIQAAGKAGNRGDRSLLSSRDGSAADKMIQVDWRR
ncbi:protein IQ-DOMAIN 31-like [Iris pallida]|uniref:Protein IQ-DOMAIN 31-like n=1 Tax=Iris pallida TaxID=29817 RepID=A0AAX6F8Z2_IRIPA|nr:protein IQ-DOMAIN 31-like [Iris pallida]KAJ6812816.1 protein IQ-DOMAIN 31-like [Iris pallida]